MKYVHRKKTTYFKDQNELLRNNNLFKYNLPNYSKEIKNKHHGQYKILIRLTKSSLRNKFVEVKNQHPIVNYPSEVVSYFRICSKYMHIARLPPIVHTIH